MRGKQKTDAQSSEVKPQDTEANVRSIYVDLLHEMQFRCTKNALINYQQAEIYQHNGGIWKRLTIFCTAISTSGVLASILKKGQVLANKFGIAGLFGLPICGIMQLVESSTSEFVPSYFELARKHTCSAAGYMHLAEMAKEMQLRLKLDSHYDIDKLISQYSEMMQRKEEIAKEALLPIDTHRNYTVNAETVYLHMKKRERTYQDYLDQAAKFNNSVETKHED